MEGGGAGLRGPDAAGGSARCRDGRHVEPLSPLKSRAARGPSWPQVDVASVLWRFFRKEIVDAFVLHYISDIHL